MAGAVEIDKTVYWQKELGKRQFSMTRHPAAPCSWPTRAKLMTGDIVGFVTHRPDLDYFHVGFVVFGPKGELLLRHAAKSRHRVLDERMDRFIAVNGVRLCDAAAAAGAEGRRRERQAAAAFGFTSAV